MGATVSNLQILGVPEETVRAALPGVPVGRWSERFVTACPDLSPRQTEELAAALSGELDCALLLVSMFDGDALWLTVYQGGKRLTGHTALLEADLCNAGTPKLFCSALGLPAELAPSLRRLFTDCAVQEEKLAILQALLGAPLFLRWDSAPPQEVLRADAGPLEQWLRERPVPPKLSNRCTAELLQEIPDRMPEPAAGALILRPAVRDEDEDCWVLEPAGDILGYACVGGEWACRQSDGRLELVPLAGRDGAAFACLGDRLVSASVVHREDPAYPEAGRLPQTVVTHDTAGILPCPIPLTLEGRIARADLTLLADGGFLASIHPCSDHSSGLLHGSALVRYGPDGTQKWTHPGASYLGQAADRVYALAKGDGEPRRMLALDLDGSAAAEYPIPSELSSPIVQILGDRPYLLDLGNGMLYRLTPDLRPDGQVRLLSATSSLALSPDGTLLYAAGFLAGLQTIDAGSLQVLHEQPSSAQFCAAASDGQQRLWVANKSYFECYTPDLKLISRHRLKGSVLKLYQNSAGQVCAVTFQKKGYITRVYRFS